VPHLNILLKAIPIMILRIIKNEKAKNADSKDILRGFPLSGK
jgi:hypothetical protein